MINKTLFGIMGILFLSIASVATSQFRATESLVLPALSNDEASKPDGIELAAASASATHSAQKPGTFTLAQIAAHNSAQSCFTTVEGSVYDVTSFIDQHPGGVEAILSLCGKDGTTAFTNQHGGQRRPANELASSKIGTLAK